VVVIYYLNGWTDLYKWWNSLLIRLKNNYFWLKSYLFWSDLFLSLVVFESIVENSSLSLDLKLENQKDSSELKRLPLIFFKSQVAGLKI
jgi:hypothetical protein